MRRLLYIIVTWAFGYCTIVDYPKMFSRHSFNAMYSYCLAINNKVTSIPKIPMKDECMSTPCSS